MLTVEVVVSVHMDFTATKEAPILATMKYPDGAPAIPLVGEIITLPDGTGEQDYAINERVWSSPSRSGGPFRKLQLHVSKLD